MYATAPTTAASTIGTRPFGAGATAARVSFGGIAGGGVPGDTAFDRSATGAISAPSNCVSSSDSDNGGINPDTRDYESIRLRQGASFTAPVGQLSGRGRCNRARAC